ncbi:hypothetical protein JZO82_04045 [Vagococcus fluvialis]|uniref:hypothetical protein n=1 Tax=Vagococcus fluvialis TaxID=2738 RepID=UPI001A8F6AB1|nr:hypothetical protein [Vagococcus fluvialis]MBO0428327.1 hypothetical protein [Vagococcus fluvialis]
MAKQTDIKSLSIFGGDNPGLKKMREQADKEKKNVAEKSTLSEVTESLKIDNETLKETDNLKKELPAANDHENNFKQDDERVIKDSKKQIKNPKGAGAPIRQFDRVYSAKSPLKLSALLNSTSRNLVEKYETQLSRDELLRKALDEYIRQHLSLEDKHELYHAVLKDLEIFREKFPTIPEKNQRKEIIRNVSEIEQETEIELKKRWGIK